MAASKTELIEIRPIKIQKTTIRIVGDSPLIMHAWDAKAKRQILEKEMGFPKTTAKENKNPIADFASSMYWLTPQPNEYSSEVIGNALESARFGFPVTAFKQAAISAAYRMGWSKDKMSMRGAFFIDPAEDGYYASDMQVDFVRKRIEIIPNTFHAMQMVEIFSDTPVMREDMVSVGISGTDIRYRGEFRNWYADLTISYNTNGQHSLDQIINIINAGGYVCGVGEWRPERDGQYGMFHVESV